MEWNIKQPRNLLKWWSTATGFNGGQFCRFKLFKSLWSTSKNIETYKTEIDKKDKAWSRTWTLYFFDRLLQSSDFTRQLFKRFQFSGLFSCNKTNLRIMDNKLLSRSLMGLGEGGLYKQTVDIKFHSLS